MIFLFPALLTYNWQIKIAYLGCTMGFSKGVQCDNSTDAFLRNFFFY